MNNVFKIFLQKSYLKIEKVGHLKAGLIPWYLELMWILSLHLKHELDGNLKKKNCYNWKHCLKHGKKVISIEVIYMTFWTMIYLTICYRKMFISQMRLKDHLRAYTLILGADNMWILVPMSIQNLMRFKKTVIIELCYET